MQKNSDRIVVIDQILSDLEKLKISGFDNEYALNENIVFFHAAKNFFYYFMWLVTHVPKIDADRLLELTDLDFPKWKEELHLSLIEMSRRKFPGLIKPLCDYLVSYVLKKHPLFILDIGSGSMEIERQVISRLINHGIKNKPIFIGLDNSPTACRIAKKNLSQLGEIIEIHELINWDDVFALGINDTNQKFKTVLINNDLSFLSKCGDKQLDLIFYSKFKHHLPADIKKELEDITGKKAKIVAEYDDYKSFHFLVPQSMGAWRYPVLMNGAIFSRLRCPSKGELATNVKEEEYLKFFYKIKSYLKIINDKF